MPDIFNTDQGVEFTSEAFTHVLREADIAISMDVKGQWVDNAVVECQWRIIKYEEVYLKVYAMAAQASVGFARISHFIIVIYSTRARTGKHPIMSR